MSHHQLNSAIPMANKFLVAVGVTAVFLAALSFTARAAAPDAHAERRKANCVSYLKMTRAAEAAVGAQNLSEGLRQKNRTFIEFGCLSNLRACPVTSNDVMFVDMLTVMTINANMGSTFMPFGCPERPHLPYGT